tara:strand:- start:264 stop:1121 length:858 start_codon:yes stop_codon:yes gene_type:complete
MKGNHILNSTKQYSGNFHVIDVDGTNDRIALGATSDLKFSQANIDSHGLSISVWYYPWNSTVGSGQIPLFTIGDGAGLTNNYRGISVGIDNNGNMYMHIFGNNSSGGAGAGSNNRRTRKTSTTPVPSKAWSHLVFSFPDSDHANWKMFVNGANQALATASGTAATYPVYGLTSHIGFNGRTSAAAYVSNGFIGDVAIWKNEITQAAANSMYLKVTSTPANSGLDLLMPVGSYTNTMAQDLVGWWRMGDDEGQSLFSTIPDEIEGTNDGTMSNMIAGDIVTTPLWG